MRYLLTYLVLRVLKAPMHVVQEVVWLFKAVLNGGDAEFLAAVAGAAKAYRIYDTGIIALKLSKSKIDPDTDKYIADFTVGLNGVQEFLDDL